MLNKIVLRGMSLDTSTNEIVVNVLNVLSSYLQSNEHLRLGESFMLKFRVLSEDHVLHRMATQGYKPHYAGKVRSNITLFK